MFKIHPAPQTAMIDVIDSNFSWHGKNAKAIDVDS